MRGLPKQGLPRQMGPSYIIAVGSHTGGELWIYDPTSTDMMRVEKKSWVRHGAPWAKIGEALSRTVLDVKGKLTPFDGRLQVATQSLGF